MKAQKIARLKNKEYRDAFVGSQISVGLPFQIRALREERGWKQSRLALEAGMLQPRISAMEKPGEAKFNLETLRRIASAFDVALVVRFVPFSELIDWSNKFNPDHFHVPNFAEELEGVDHDLEVGRELREVVGPSPAARMGGGLLSPRAAVWSAAWKTGQEALLCYSESWASSLTDSLKQMAGNAPKGCVPKGTVGVRRPPKRAKKKVLPATTEQVYLYLRAVA